MKVKNQFRNKLVIVYFLSILLSSTTIGISLRDQWNRTIVDAAKITIKDLEITSKTTKYILSNGLKLLDITNLDLYQLIASNRYDYKSIQKIVSNAASLFSIDNKVENYGLLTVNDKEGNLIARSDGLSVNNINFSDRYYFKELKKDPNKKLSVGPLLIARTTGKRIFSIAVPIKDIKGKFNGTLALQISEDSIAKIVKLQIGESSESITAVTADNEIIFTTLSKKIDLSPDTMVNFSNVFGGLEYKSDKGWEKRDDFIFAVRIDPELQITYVAIEPIAQLYITFLKSNIKLFTITAISYAIFSYLIWFIYRQFLQADQARLESFTDQLTQLPNRRAFDERYESFLKDAHRSQSDISILFIDIDRFKFCNDEYGHENGDLVLKTLANIIQSCMRRPLDFCCRWGGEELVALLPDTTESGASEVAEQILNIVRETPIQINGHSPIYITVSIGIATAHYHQNTAPENNLVDRADQAMYRAKQGGRDRYSL